MKHPLPQERNELKQALYFARLASSFWHAGLYTLSAKMVVRARVWAARHHIRKVFSRFLPY